MTKKITQLNLGYKWNISKSYVLQEASSLKILNKYIKPETYQVIC